MREWQRLLLIVAVFAFFFFVPLDGTRLQTAILEGFLMLQDYARLHVLLCLVPAFFIAGAIQNFISKEAVLKYFGPKSNKPLAYSIASISGAILAVCSCTVLPMFMGIYQAGAGLGVATTFLYSGPAINVLAILMTGRVLGMELGLARAIGAVVFSVVVGLAMSFIFRRSEQARAEASGAFDMEAARGGRRLGQNILYFASMILALVFLTWGKPREPIGFYNAVFSVHWYLAGAALVLLALMVWRWFSGEERRAWVASTWTFARQILPLLFGGVFVAGFLLGRPGLNAGIIPDSTIAGLVGGNSLMSNLFASVAGALMYFATLTEIPVLQGLIGSGMSKGPALALLLAGPALSLPSVIVVTRLVGAKRAFTYIGLVVVLSTVVGLIYGAWF